MPVACCLFAVALLQIGVLWDGAQVPAALMVAAAWGLLLYGVVRMRRDGMIIRAWHAPLAVVLAAAGLLLQMPFDPLNDPVGSAFADAWSVAAPAIAALLVLAYGVPRLRAGAVRSAAFAVAVCTALAFAAWVPAASPDPVVDVYRMMGRSADALLRGDNPYTSSFPDIYRGASVSKPLTTYTYPPGSLLLMAPAKALAGDVRFATVIALLAVVVALRMLAASAVWGEALALLFVLHPRTALLVEQTWIDPLLLASLAVALVAWTRGWERLGAAVFGFFVGLKQYLVFFPVHALLLKPRSRVVPWALAACLLPMLPFVFWQPSAFLHNGILFHLGGTFLPETLSLPALLYPLTGWEPGRGWSLLVGGMLSAITLRLCAPLPRHRGFAFAAALTTLGIFVFGSQAIANYLWLAGGIALLALATAEPERS